MTLCTLCGIDFPRAAPDKARCGRCERRYSKLSDTELARLDVEGPGCESCGEVFIFMDIVDGRKSLCGACKPDENGAHV